MSVIFRGLLSQDIAQIDRTKFNVVQMGVIDNNFIVLPNSIYHIEPQTGAENKINFFVKNVSDARNGKNFEDLFMIPPEVAMKGNVTRNINGVNILLYLPEEQPSLFNESGKNNRGDVIIGIDNLNAVLNYYWERNQNGYKTVSQKK